MSLSRVKHINNISFSSCSPQSTIDFFVLPTLMWTSLLIFCFNCFFFPYRFSLFFLFYIVPPKPSRIPKTCAFIMMSVLICHIITTMLTLIKLMTNMHLVISFHFTTIHSATHITTATILRYSSMIAAARRKHTILNINSIQSHLKVRLSCIIEMFVRFQIQITSRSIFNIFKSILLSRK